MKRMLLIFSLVLSLLALQALPALAAEATEVPETPAAPDPLYLSFTGTVTEVRPFTEQDGTENDAIRFVLLEGDDDSLMNFRVDEGTLLSGEPKLEAGEKLIGFYDGNAPMTLIYPPQPNALAIVPFAEGEQAAMAYFDADLVSVDGMLKIATDDNTEIATQSGAEFTGELGERVLLVTYGPSTRSIPAQATALRVVVMDALSGAADGAGESSPYVINGEELSLAAPIGGADSELLVPLTPIAEALGMPLVEGSQQGEYQMGRSITLTVGKDYYTFARMAPIELGIAPVEQDGEIYVPLSFFTEVARFSTAVYEDGQVVITE